MDHVWKFSCEMPNEQAFSMDEKLSPEVTVAIFETKDPRVARVEIYFTAAQDKKFLAGLAGHKNYEWERLPNIDWVAENQRSFAVIEAGRFFVYPSFHHGQIPAEKISLCLDPGRAFGTGHHGTTKGCLLMIDRLAEKNISSVLDVGCGTGILAMAATKVFPGPVFASDIDPDAVDVAVENARLNGILEKISFATGDGVQTGGIMDLIVANILSLPLIDMAVSICDHLGKGGYLILSGFDAPQAVDVLVAYEKCGCVEVAREELDDWVSLLLQRV